MPIYNYNYSVGEYYSWKPTDQVDVTEFTAMLCIGTFILWHLNKLNMLLPGR